MTHSTKTKSVESGKELLDLCAQSFKARGEEWIAARVVALPEGRAEIRFEVEKLRQSFLVWPSLAPSRKLLQAKAEAGGKPILLLCPHLPNPLAKDLRAAGLNHADLNGRLFVKTRTFLLDREPKNDVYRNPGTELNPFTLKSSRVARALLAHREQAWTQADLQKHTGISRGLVSLILTDLIGRELVTQTRPGRRHGAARYRVRDFDRLLDGWSEEDRWRKRTTIQQYSTLTGNVVELAETVRDALGLENVFFTQWFGAHLRHPHTTPPLVSAYVKKKPFGEITWGRRVDNGGNVWLITPKDEGVFQETQTVGGFNLVSDIQIYLDLLAVEQRGPEQAKALRAWKGFAK